MLSLFVTLGIKNGEVCINEKAEGDMSSKFSKLIRALKRGCDKQTRMLTDFADNPRMSASRLIDRFIPLHLYRIGFHLKVIDPETRAEFTRICISMQAALDQASMLLRNGYNIEIWSPAFLEVPKGNWVH